MILAKEGTVNSHDERVGGGGRAKVAGGGGAIRVKQLDDRSAHDHRLTRSCCRDRRPYRCC